MRFSPKSTNARPARSGARLPKNTAMSRSDDHGQRALERLPSDALRAFRDRQRSDYETLRRQGRPFNLARGKPFMAERSQR
jgi:hypothetical protein